VTTRHAQGRPPAPPIVHADSLARIDPKTNRISHVIDVGLRPMAAAVGGRSVWTYNEEGRSVSEIDSTTRSVRKTTPVRARPVDLSLRVGPVLAADAAGAWLIGRDRSGRSLLTRLPSGGGKPSDYRLDREPLAVSVGQGAVWVAARSARDSQILRVDPDTGRVTARIVLPASARVDGLDVGLGSVWAGSSATATVYRIDPRAAKVSGRVDLGTRAGRPEVKFGRLWIGVSDDGGQTILVNPRSLETVLWLNCCKLGAGYDSVDRYGSTWTTDWWTGTVERWDGITYQITAVIHVTDPPFYAPASRGLCLTSLAAGAGAVWVSVSQSEPRGCRR
jgi:streptogramin lyase